MKISGIVVCVDYSDLLARGLERWKSGLERMLVVTSSADVKTQELCRQHKVDVFVTDIFYTNGARFNKGAALSVAIDQTGWRNDADWLLLFDADIVPPKHWKSLLEQSNLQIGKLYGTYRWAVPETANMYTIDNMMINRNEQVVDARVLPDSRRHRQLVTRARRRNITGSMPQGWVIGFFMLFHSSDKHLPETDKPMFEMHWSHAGNYDTNFANLWNRRTEQVLLTTVRNVHLGEERVHWFGRGNKQELYDQCLGPEATKSGLQHKPMLNPPVFRK